MRILLGPILFVLDGAPLNVWTRMVLSCILVPAMFLVACRLRWWSALISVLAALAWLFLGILGEGINC